jgi:hypothetical protein
VEWLERKDFQDEHVKRALQKGGICRRRFHIDNLFIQTVYTRRSDGSQR